MASPQLRGPRTHLHIAEALEHTVGEHLTLFGDAAVHQLLSPVKLLLLGKPRCREDRVVVGLAVVPALLELLGLLVILDLRLVGGPRRGTPHCFVEILELVAQPGLDRVELVLALAVLIGRLDLQPLHGVAHLLLQVADLLDGGIAPRSRQERSEPSLGVFEL